MRGNPHAFSHGDEIASRIAQAPAVAVILDYDGTITPIMSQPDLAILADCTRNLLRHLASADHTHVAIVSGRALEDVASKVGLDLIYAGNHGLEIQCQGTRFKEPTAASYAPALQTIVAAMHQLLDGVEGVLVENKGLSASVHFRKAPREAEETIRFMAEQAVQSDSGRFLLREGKKVIELRPTVAWNKGTAARWILDRLPPGTLPVCLGDDVTDEDMFNALPNGITISVGPNEDTAARYHVADVDEALRFLSSVRDGNVCAAQ
jgi:trehalose 6-phosphate phosphatase